MFSRHTGLTTGNVDDRPWSAFAPHRLRHGLRYEGTGKASQATYLLLICMRVIPCWTETMQPFHGETCFVNHSLKQHRVKCSRRRIGSSYFLVFFYERALSRTEALSEDIAVHGTTPTCNPSESTCVNSYKTPSRFSGRRMSFQSCYCSGSDLGKAPRPKRRKCRPGHIL